VKVLLHADAVGGVFTYAVELARALAARGVRVILATEGAALTPDQHAGVATIPGVVHAEGAFRLEWMPEPWADVAAAGAWLLELERREQPDVVHLDAFAHGALPFRAPKLVVGHSCVLSWFEAVKGTPAPAAEWERYRRAVRAGLRGASAVAAPSRAMAAALVRHYGPIPAPAVIPNGRSAARFPPGEKAPLVLGAGRLWDEAKNAAALAAVAPELPWAVAIAGAETAPPPPNAPPNANPNANPEPVPVSRVPCPVSPGPLRLTPIQPSTALPSPGQATLLGRLPEAELAAWLARASIFAHPARYEPFGLAVLEAALAGCALVLGDLPSLRENWDDAAVFVPPDDRAALAGALRGLAADGGRRAAYADAARRRALELGPERMADRTLALYRALVARRTGARPSP
jgi:glycogen synthase